MVGPRYTASDFRIDRAPWHNGEAYSLETSAPSNIALIKYWGKQEGQLQRPLNPSLSLTLDKSRTFTSARLRPSDTPGRDIRFRFYLDDRHQPDFEPKIARFFERIKPYAPYIEAFEWEIRSRNTFPHGSGIASSASGFAALAKLVMQLEEALLGPLEEDYKLAKTSFLARLGSGSAARSVAAPAMIWGRHPLVQGSTDEYAIRLPFALPEAFGRLRDTILLVDSGQKAVSSTEGHRLLENHPYREARIRQANEHFALLLEALRQGDWNTLGRITEAEALSLHGLMMTSSPYYILMKPLTLEIIQKLWEWRGQNNLPVYFTLDAGANVHLIYPDEVAGSVREWLEKNFTRLIQNNAFIDDKIIIN